MNINELKKYCPCKNIKIIDTGYLDNYIFQYRLIKGKKNIKAKANIEPRKNSKVYGLVININGTINKLNKKEGLFDNIYFIKHKLKIHSISSNKIYSCFAYIMEPSVRLKISQPSFNYCKKIFDAATLLNFPKPYLKRILY
tara:strand:- start:46 stop:468 length:423 start_codon:yes stop_codon:yes gene_type:complete